jgi:SpoVK/Ycf46/Vps4 family AAA+-type ATPase
MSNSAVTQAETFSENEGIVTIERSQAKGAMDYWEKAAGVEGIKDELVKAVMLPMENKSEAKKFGVRPAKGILLYGPPGTGKTTLLRGLAAKLGVRYVEVNPGQIMTKWYGESERKMKSIFDDALANPPTILAMDEVDAVAKDRSSYTADDVTPRLLNIILMGMDDVNRSDEDVVVVATTNKPQMLDKALTRPGRFDKVMYLGPPDEKAREAIFRRYLEGKDVVAKGLDYARLAKLSERFTGADIEALVNKVLSGAFYDQVKSKEAPETVVTQKLLEDAVTSTRPSVTFSMLEEYERFRVEFQRERRIQKGWESGVPNVRFDDIGGMDDIKAELRETIELPLTQPDLMEKLKVKMAKGVLLYGPPGNGKTMLAKAVATEVAANFFVLSGADLAKSGPADAASKIKELFNVAKDNQPSVIFIDEVDQLAPDRSDPFGAAFAPVTTQLLAELDGVRELKGVMVLAATNLPERIDPALLRAGRLEKHMEIPNPDTKERREILVISTRGVKLGEDVNLDLLAEKTEAFSAADLQQLVNEAKKVILREMVKGGTRDVVTMHDFDIALQSKKKSTLGEGD